MTNILLVGALGAMGRTLTNILKNNSNIRIIAGVDKSSSFEVEYPIYNNIYDCDIKCDVIIDFSSSSITDEVVSYAIDKKLPLVLCTTGLSEEQINKVNRAAEIIPILRSANMSIGINLISNILEKISSELYNLDYDIEIVEKHHNLKKDAPSGTAIFLADSIKGSIGKDLAYTYDRSSRDISRPKDEIGISAIRGGNIVGDHDVIFAGLDEVITISHRAYSKSLFATGAIKAAEFLKDKKPGLYNMKNVF